ncbi:hypothetical protein, partial [Rhodoflexus caldus]
MKKEFNVTGTCRPAEHYMMDDTRRFTAIMDFVERGKYFVINRPRQYGKTTMLAALRKELQERSDYLPIVMNFQGLDSAVYASDIAFGQFFYKQLISALQRSPEFENKQVLAELPLPEHITDLSERI